MTETIKFITYGSPGLGKVWLHPEHDPYYYIWHNYITPFFRMTQHFSMLDDDDE